MFAKKLDEKLLLCVYQNMSFWKIYSKFEFFCF